MKKSVLVVLFLLPLLLGHTAFGDVNSELLRAAVAGNTAEVKQLLKQGANANAANPYGKTVLMDAAAGGHTETVKALLDSGANVNGQYLAQGANVYAKKKFGDTALITSAKGGHTETVKFLVSAGADLEAQDWNYRTAILVATLKGHTETVAVLIDAGADVNTKDKWAGTALIFAAMAPSGDSELVAILIAAGADITAQIPDGRNPLMWAAGWGQNDEKVKVLIDAGADVNAKADHGMTALMFAAMGGRTERVKSLIAAGADVNAESEDGDTALDIAIERHRSEVVEVLQLAAAHAETATYGDIDAELLKAVEAGNTSKVERLLKQGANAKTENGQTALFGAAQSGRTEIVLALTDAGADVNWAYEFGFSALIVAARMGHSATVTALIAAGADVNAKTADGMTALIAAAQARHIGITDILLDAGADVNAQTDDGRSAALMIAAARHNTEDGESPGDWRQFGFNAQSTGFNPFERTIGRSNVNELEVLWSNKTNCTVNLGAAVVDGVVYYGNYCREMLAVDAATGSVLWKKRIAGKHSGQSVVDGVVYVTASCVRDPGNCAKVYALDATNGSTLWTWVPRAIGVKSPIVVDGVLYVTVKGTLQALDATTGNELWSRTPGGVGAIAGGVIYAVFSNTLLALNADNGDKIWQGVTDGEVLSSSAVANGTVYIHSRRGHLYAFDAKGCGRPHCDPLWIGQIPADMKAGPQAPAIAEGRVYLGSNSTFYAFDANGCDDGQCSPVWTSRTESGFFERSPPSVANGVVYSAAGNSYLYAFDSTTGEILWKHYTADRPLPMRASPVIADGRLYHAATFYLRFYAFHVK